MVYDIASAEEGRDGNYKNACGHNLPRHGGGCTPDGCVFYIFLALSDAFRKTGLGWNAAEFVKGNSDGQETRPITSSVTGGAASMIPLIPFDQDATPNADSSGDCCDNRGCCDCSSSSCDPGCLACDANCAGGPC